MIDILIFAIIAAFIAYRLYKALGDTKYDNDLPEETRKAYEEFKELILRDIEQAKGGIEHAESELEANLTPEERETLVKVRKYHPNFALEKFLKNAKAAFGAIIEAYSSRDVDILKELVSNEMLERFLVDINALKEKGQRRSMTLVGVHSASIVSVAENQDKALIKVKFESEQISNIIDDSSGELMSGSLSKVIKKVDTWTFEKEIKSNSYTWILVENE